MSPRAGPTHARAWRPPRSIVSRDSGRVQDSYAVRGCGHVEYPDGMRRGADPAVAARLSGAGHPYTMISKEMRISEKGASRRPWIRHGKVVNHPGWPCRLEQDHARACVGGMRPRKRPHVGAAPPGHMTVGLLRLLRPRPLDPAGRAALGRARSLLNRDLHPIPSCRLASIPFGALNSRRSPSAARSFSVPLL